MIFCECHKCYFNSNENNSKMNVNYVVFIVKNLIFDFAVWSLVNFCWQLLENTMCIALVPEKSSVRFRLIKHLESPEPVCGNMTIVEIQLMILFCLHALHSMCFYTGVVISIIAFSFILIRHNFNRTDLPSIWQSGMLSTLVNTNAETEKLCSEHP